MENTTKLRQNQRGFAAIMIAVVLMVVLSLITVGFAELMRHNQEQALNRQLSSQAYYAAESGINDAAKALSEGYNQHKKSCNPLTPAEASDVPGSEYLMDDKVGTTTGAEYTCLLINPTPKSLEYDPIGTTESKVVEITGIDSDGDTKAIDHIVVSWQDSNGSRDFTTWAGHPFPSSNTWGDKAGVLRLSMTPITGASYSRGSLANSTFTAFLYPNSSSGYAAGSENYGSSSGNGGGQIVNGNCNTEDPNHSDTTPRYCNVVITGMSAPSYILDMRSIYNPTTVTVVAYDNSNSPIEIKNAQTVVDSTGKAQGVLKRIQVRIPSRNSPDHPDFSLDTGASICKQFQIEPGHYANSAYCQ